MKKQHTRDSLVFSLVMNKDKKVTLKDTIFCYMNPR